MGEENTWSVPPRLRRKVYDPAAVDAAVAEDRKLNIRAAALEAALRLHGGRYTWAKEIVTEATVIEAYLTGVSAGD